MLHRDRTITTGDNHYAHPPVIPPRLAPPCVAYSPAYPPEFVVPLYNRRPSTKRYSPFNDLPPSYDDDLMTTRHINFSKSRHCRSSFDLSDILEEDDIEIEIEPHPPTTAKCVEKAVPSISLAERLKKVVVATKALNVVALFRVKSRCAGTPKVLNKGNRSGLDLLA